MTLHTIASGSEGNCLLISCGDTHILVDAGISTRRITTALAALGLQMADMDGILLTHAHHDHTAALNILCKHHETPLFASAGTAAQVCEKCGMAQYRMRIVRPGEAFSLGGITVTPFPTAHDARGSMDYRLDTETGSIGVLTDTGYVTDEAYDALCGVDLLVLESNHDIEALRSGPYPYYLKERIAGPRGHLSNDDAARFAAEMARRGTKEIVLAHLSRENNTPAMALHAVQRTLEAHGLTAAVTVAPRSELSRCYEVEVSPCRK